MYVCLHNACIYSKQYIPVGSRLGSHREWELRVVQYNEKKKRNKKNWWDSAVGYRYGLYDHKGCEHFLYPVHIAEWDAQWLLNDKSVYVGFHNAWIYSKQQEYKLVGSRLGSHRERRLTPRVPHDSKYSRVFSRYYNEPLLI